jgi:hypothetical protein
MASFFKTDPILKEYQRFRKTGRDLNHKIINACLNETILTKATTMLKLGQKGQLILDSEDDLSVLMDFALFEIHHKDGRNSVEQYAETKDGTNAIERELLTAMVQAQTGLYKVKRVLRDKHQIVLENVITPEAPTTLTDIGFSQTMIAGLCIFLRPVSLSKFTMTSGVAFVFPSELQQELRAYWKHLEIKSNAERYAKFFRKSKQSGIETTYV